APVLLTALRLVQGFALGGEWGGAVLLVSEHGDARRRGCACVVVTFDPDPDDLLVGPRASSRLLEVGDRVRAIATLGVDAIVTLDFGPSLAQTPYREFVSSTLDSVVRPISVHVGTNFRFGARGEGDVAALAAIGRARGFEAHAHELVTAGGETVSATRIRALLHKGGVEDASGLLDRLHWVRGVVEHGRGEGTSFGFPTANVRVPRAACMPADGVYACVVCDGATAWPAAANVGAPPTFSAPEEAFLEANLLGFDGDLYGSEVSVLFVRWLRASRTFPSTDELERVVLGNIDWVRKNLGDRGVGVRS
ncbi:MAG: riboflavin kinase, partial [Parafannyhessea sp.]|uniref:riboflavin kinase n=1 Tax=Parafannyhessea sp. TaxID=2847324 RepID=UPI003F12472D